MLRQTIVVLLYAQLSSACAFVYQTATPSPKSWMKQPHKALQAGASSADLQARHRAQVRKQGKWALGFFGLGYCGAGLVVDPEPQEEQLP